jgi:hypothetical protein
VVDDSLLKYWLETGYPHQSFVWFSLVSPGECHDSALK